MFVGKTQYYLGPGEYTDSWGVVSFDPAEGPPPDLLDRLPKEFPPTVTPVYAFPTLKYLEVLELARVGTENDLNEDVLKSLFRDKDPDQRAILVDCVTAMGGLRKFVDKERNSLKITGRTRHQQVVSGLTKLMKIAPFAITLAEPNELKARFVEPLSDEVAYQAARIVFVLSAESYDCHPEEIAQRLINKEMFRLGWRSW